MAVAGSAGSPRAPLSHRKLLLADMMGPALLLMLDALSPAERLAFVLHDLFAVPFDEVAPILGRSVGAPLLAPEVREHPSLLRRRSRKWRSGQDLPRRRLPAGRSSAPWRRRRRAGRG
jgi:hypothetical protein